MYATEAAVAGTADACRNLFVDRKIKEEAPQLRAAAEAKAAKEARRVGRKEQGAESRRHSAPGCEKT